MEAAGGSALPAERLETERPLLRPLPSLLPRIGRAEIRKVDKLSTIRVASVRFGFDYAYVPHDFLDKTQMLDFRLFF